jgi:hypothetical protein
LHYAKEGSYTAVETLQFKNGIIPFKLKNIQFSFFCSNDYTVVITFEKVNLNFMKLFWTTWIIDAIASMVIVYFFFIGILDGTVSQRNAGMWGLLLLAVAAVTAGSIYFYRRGQMKTAWILLSLMAIPAILMFIFMLIVIFGDVRWN